MTKPTSTNQTSQETLETGIAYYQAGELTRAIDVFEAILHNEPHHADALNMLGVCHSQLGHADKALNYLQQATQYAPRTSQYYCNLGNVLTAQAMYSEAEAAFEHAIALKPDNAEVYNNLGFMHYRADNISAAKTCYEKALTFDAGLKQAQKNLAQCYLALSEPAMTIEMLTTYQSNNPDDKDVDYLLGMAYQKIGDVISAMRHFQAAIQYDATNADIYHRIGVIYYDVGEFEMAADMYRLAVEYRTQFPEAFSNLGNALLQLGDYETALQSYIQANKLNPQSTEIVNNMGAAHRELDDYDNARCCFETAIEMDASYLPAYENLAALEILEGDRQAAETVYQAAIKAVPCSIDTHIELAKYYLGTEQFEKAKQQLEHALEIEDSQQRATLWLAKYHWLLGETTESLALIESLCEITPDNVQAEVMRGALYLFTEQFTPGWQAHEKRWLVTDYASDVFSCDLKRITSGDDLNDKHVVIWAENDNERDILFASLLSDAAQHAQSVTFFSRTALSSLLKPCHPTINFISHADKLPEHCDYQIALGDLGRVLRTSAQDFTSPSAYMQADREKQQHYATIYRADNYQGIVVGLYTGDWTNNSGIYQQTMNERQWQQFVDKHKNEIRTVQFLDDDQAPLINVDYHQDDIHAMHHWDDTVAALANVDILITSDSCLAHLSGALGITTWLILPHNPQWYWHEHRSDSLWYANMRLFRMQSSWDHVSQQLMQALSEHLTLNT